VKKTLPFQLLIINCKRKLQDIWKKVSREFLQINI